MEPVDGFVAMLLRIDYGSASTRQHLFGACRIFSRKIELTKRIRWFEGTTGNPSFNHAWFVWDWHHRGRPELLYAPPVALPVAHASRPGQERNCRRDDCDHGRRGGRENSESGTNCGYHE